MEPIHFLFLAALFATITTASTNWGSCTAPLMQWDSNASGFTTQGTKDYSHGPVDLEDMTEYLCSTVQDACKAPSASITICHNAAAAALKKTGQDAVDEWDRVISGGTEKTESFLVQNANVKTDRKMAFSITKDYVEFEGFLDPKWWFDTYINLNNDVCDESSHRMPGKHYLSFRCHGDVPHVTAPAMKAAIGALTSNSSFFKHYTRESQVCKSFNTQGGCTQYDRVQKPYTGMPRTMSCYVSSGQHDEGELSYEIVSGSGGWDCAACRLAAPGLTIVGSVAGSVTPYFGPAGAVITIGCALAGC